MVPMRRFVRYCEFNSNYNNTERTQSASVMTVFIGQWIEGYWTVGQTVFEALISLLRPPWPSTPWENPMR